ncbi:hypothetical protein BDY24DRAFT_332529, partial [Mrakia frigida]|uniref:uncharacterized protein n=1 Tax=Mrakia frigida TaxID=29902 RepID=UPI003FCC1408
LLFNLYAADFSPTPHRDDPVLAGLAISLITHADDTALISTSLEGLQSKINDWARFANLNLVVTSAEKSSIVIFGRVPHSSLLVPVVLNGSPIPFAESAKFIGITFTGGSRLGRFEQHAQATKKKVISGANSTLQMQRFTGLMDARELMVYERGLIDPLMVFGSPVTLGMRQQDWEVLEKQQLSFLRRVLHLPPNSKTAPLFLLTSTLPIR